MNALERVLQIMEQLRDPQGGCPWDTAQTFETIAPHTIEEAYEVVEAIESGDRVALREELADLLFQVVFYAQLGKEAGSFDFASIAEALSDKLVRRHPHVFGEEGRRSGSRHPLQWERDKALERDRTVGRPLGVMEGVSRALPALTRAVKIQRRAASVGFDWSMAEAVLEKLEEEVAELRAACGGGQADQVAEELGDVLFTCVNLARHVSLDPETALRHAIARFERRFRLMEDALAREGRRVEEVSGDELEVLWQRAKTAARAAKQ